MTGQRKYSSALKRSFQGWKSVRSKEFSFDEKVLARKKKKDLLEALATGKSERRKDFSAGDGNKFP